MVHNGKCKDLLEVGYGSVEVGEERGGGGGGCYGLLAAGWGYWWIAGSAGRRMWCTGYWLICADMLGDL